MESLLRASSRLLSLLLFFVPFKDVKMNVRPPAFRLLLLLLLSSTFFKGLDSLASLITGPDRHAHREFETVNLRCVINNCDVADTCSVQWIGPDFSMLTYETKDSISLQPDPLLTLRDPDPSSPDWSLRISRLVVDNEGDYRCNLVVNGYVKATKTIGLQVIVNPKPLEPLITGPSSSIKIEDQISVTPGQVELTCASGEARPAVKLRWERLRNHGDDDDDDDDVDVLGSSDQTTVTSRTVPARKEGTYDTESKLTLFKVGVAEYDQSRFRCVAIYGSEDDPKVSKSNIVLNIQHAPSSPTIDYEDQTGNNEGDRVKVDCSVMGGNPEPTVTWYFADEPLHILPATASSTSSRRLTSTLTLTLSREIFDRALVCDVGQKLLPGGRASANVTLPVRFPPEFLRISGADANFRAGDRRVLSCRTAPANPPWDVKWTVQPNPAFKTRNSRATAGRWRTRQGWISESNITIDVTQAAALQNTRVDCEAFGGIGTQPLIASKLLKSMTAPDRVEMFLKPKRTTLKEGEGLEIGCAAVGESHPEAGVEIVNASSGESLGPLAAASAAIFSAPTSASSRGKRPLVLTRSSNGVRLCCRVVHPVFNDTFKFYRGPEECQTFHVHFEVASIPAPERLAPASSRPVTAPSKVVLSCATPTANPPPEVAWLCNGVPCDAEKFDVGRTVYERDSFLGQRARSTISFSSSGRHDLMSFGCRAKHIGGSDVDGAELTLRVQYPPEFSSLVVTPGGRAAKIKILEGQNKSLTEFEPRANPPVTELRWKRKRNGRYVDIVTSSSRKRKRSKNRMSFQIDDRGILSILHAHRSGSGDYVVSASNARGRRDVFFSVDVQFPPEFLRVASNGRGGGASGAHDVFHAEEGANVTLACRARANPIDEETLQWRPPREVGERGKATVEIDRRNSISTITYTIEGVKKDDVGLYTCLGNNQLQTKAQQTLMTTTVVSLVVDYAPVFSPTSPSKFAAKLGYNATLTCSALGSPKISFNWCKAEVGCPWGGLSTAEPHKYVEVTRKLSETSWQSTLTILNADANDLGRFLCSASNRLGCEGEFGRRDGACDKEIELTAESASGMEPLHVAILTSCAGGVLLVTLNVVVIVCCVRRNRKRRGNKREDNALPNGMELYGTPNSNSANLPPYESFNYFHDDFREHYGSHVTSGSRDKGGAFEDYGKDYSDEEVKCLTHDKLSASNVHGIHFRNGGPHGVLGSLSAHALASHALSSAHGHHKFLPDDPYATMRSSNTTENPRTDIPRPCPASPSGSRSGSNVGSVNGSHAGSGVHRRDFVPLSSAAARACYAASRYVSSFDRPPGAVGSFDASGRPPSAPRPGVVASASLDLGNVARESPINGGYPYDELGQPPQARLSPVQGQQGLDSLVVGVTPCYVFWSKNNNNNSQVPYFMVPTSEPPTPAGDLPEDPPLRRPENPPSSAAASASPTAASAASSAAASRTSPGRPSLGAVSPTFSAERSQSPETVPLAATVGSLPDILGHPLDESPSPHQPFLPQGSRSPPR